ncbi:hypothetical protein H2248_005538 [Termitomyces sp. 'cryptogamus']|nr:hypothetical protein H2248_005538 [Termitomyces sp. 'cryptogamus']
MTTMIGLKKHESKVIECPDCSLEADLILVSSDGVSFAAHARNLERYSEGFPPSSFNSGEPDSQVVYLNESSNTVRLLLQYMHLRPQPDIEKLPFRELEELANAAEKYLIFNAMMVCKLCMKANASLWPMHVLKYAVKHGHKDLADQAASYTVVREPAEIEEFFGRNSQIFYIWLAYRQQWMIALPWIYTRDIHIPTLHKGGLKECELWKPFRDHVRSEVDCLPSQIARFEEIVSVRISLDLLSCDRCIDRARRWSTSVKATIGEVLPFSAYL